MIVICKFCDGSGQSFSTPLAQALGKRESCPACGGAGELVLPEPAENYVRCKVCGGTGSVPGPYITVFSNRTVCSGCKGAGLLTRPIITSGKGPPISRVEGPLPRPRTFDYHIALSFAGEDRGTAECYAEILRKRGLRVFLDSYEQVELWGADLYVKLDEIYRKKAMFCVVFISKHYKAKLWTKHELESAQARAFQQNKEYILPVRLDDTEIPGVRETVGYIDLRKKSVEELVEITLQKVEKEKGHNRAS